MSGTPAPPVSPLQTPLFRSLWLANVASGIGSAMHDTAAVWTMTLLTSSATLVTLMQSVSSLPLFLLALPAGALADIVDRRRLILIAQLLSALVTLLLAWIAWRGGLNPAVLLGITFVLGMGTAFTLPAWQAMIPGIVPRESLPGALALGGAGINIARSVGPITGGFLVATLGPAVVFGLNALSFAGLIVVLARAGRIGAPRAGQSEQMLGAMVAALRYTRHSPAIHAVLIRNASLVYFGIAPVALLPLLVRARGLAAGDFGILMGAYGAGGIIAAFLILPRLRQRLSLDRLLLSAGLILAAMIGVLSRLGTVPAMAVVLFVAGAAWLVSMSSFSAAAQGMFPDWVRARSSAVLVLVVQAAFASGALTWGALTGRVGPELALQIAGGGLLATLVLVRALPLNPHTRLNLDPSAHWAPHQLAFEPAPSDGPVLVTVDYHVEPASAEAFRRAMGPLRTIRLRDGAFRWSLFQDLADPSHFRESFLVGTWSEHVRQHARATVEDGAVEAEVISFHVGTTPPKVSHFLMKPAGQPDS
mgnify:CR=1 FL=1